MPKTKIMANSVKQSDVLLVNLNNNKIGSEQKGIRLCVVVQNDIGNKASPTITVVPLTTQNKKPLPTHHLLFKANYDFLSANSLALAEQITTIDKNRIIKNLGSISQDDLLMIKNCISISLRSQT